MSRQIHFLKHLGFASCLLFCLLSGVCGYPRCTVVWIKWNRLMYYIQIYVEEDEDANLVTRQMGPVSFVFILLAVLTECFRVEMLSMISKP